VVWLLVPEGTDKDWEVVAGAIIVLGVPGSATQRIWRLSMKLSPRSQLET
jgi:hypothetical protein